MGIQKLKHCPGKFNDCPEKFHGCLKNMERACLVPLRWHEKWTFPGYSLVGYKLYAQTLPTVHFKCLMYVLKASKCNSTRRKIKAFYRKKDIMAVIVQLPSVPRILNFLYATQFILSYGSSNKIFSSKC